MLGFVETIIVVACFDYQIWQGRMLQFIGRFSMRLALRFFFWSIFISEILRQWSCSTPAQSQRSTTHSSEFSKIMIIKVSAVYCIYVYYEQYGRMKQWKIAPSLLCYFSRQEILCSTVDVGNLRSHVNFCIVWLFLFPLLYLSSFFHKNLEHAYGLFIRLIVSNVVSSMSCKCLCFLIWLV